MLSVPIVLAPLSVFAQEAATVSDDSVAVASVFAGNFSLSLSIIIGIMATFLVFRAAKKLGGGLFGAVLNYIGIGMTLIVIGTIFTIVNPMVIGFWLNIISTVCFATGYVFIVIGANKLFKGIMNT